MATKKSKAIQFKNMTIDWVVNTFGLKRVALHPALQGWLANPPAPSANIAELLEKRRLDLTLMGSQWNEQELFGSFIAPVIAFAELNDEDFRTFNERELTATVDGIDLTGCPDLTIAQGIGVPGPPYFCFHEYKRQIKSKGDPEGQLLGEMLAGQSLNTKTEVIWGAIVIGQRWQFVVLQGRTYAMSKTYHADETNNLHAIYGILVNLKREIKAVINAQNEQK